jgi:hypothetical protein
MRQLHQPNSFYGSLLISFCGLVEALEQPDKAEISQTPLQKKDRSVFQVFRQYPLFWVRLLSYLPASLLE